MTIEQIKALVMQTITIGDLAVHAEEIGDDMWTWIEMIANEIKRSEADHGHGN